MFFYHQVPSVATAGHHDVSFLSSTDDFSFPDEEGGDPFATSAVKLGYVRSLQVPTGSTAPDATTDLSCQTPSLSTSSATPNISSPTSVIPSPPSSHLDVGGEKGGSACAKDTSIPSRQRLQVEREELLSIEKERVLKVASNKGPAGYVYLCRTCNKEYTVRLRCIGHAQKCGEVNLRKKRKPSQRKRFCNICNFVGTTYDQLAQHRRKEHGGVFSRRRCIKCFKSFSSFSTWVRHVRRHNSSVLFPCPESDCSRKFSTKANLKRHQKQHRESPAVEHQASQILRPLPLETTLPPVLQQRNQNIRDMWNSGLSQLFPGNFSRAKDIFSSRLTIPQVPQGNLPAELGPLGDVRALQSTSKDLSSLPSTSSSSPSSDGTSSQTCSSTAAPSNTSSLGDVHPLQDLVPLPSSNLLCSPTFSSTDSQAAAQSSTPSPGTIPLLDAESCAGISVDITSLGDVRSLLELNPTTISSSVASVSSTASSQPAGQPPTPSGTIPLPPTACQNCNTDKRKSFSCAVCLKEVRDNWALRDHMKAQHTPR